MLERKSFFTVALWWVYGYFTQLYVSLQYRRKGRPPTLRTRLTFVGKLSKFPISYLPVGGRKEGQEALQTFYYLFLSSNQKMFRKLSTVWIPYSYNKFYAWRKCERVHFLNFHFLASFQELFFPNFILICLLKQCVESYSKCFIRKIWRSYLLAEV